MADTADQLAWEEQQRPSAVLAALAAGVLMIAGLVFGSIAARDEPSPLLLDSLRQLEKPGPIGDEPSTKLPQFRFALDHIGSLLATILITLGLFAAIYALRYLVSATRARRALPSFAPGALLVGGIVMSLALLAGSIANRAYFSKVVNGSGTVDAARDQTAVSGVVGLLALLGLFAFSGAVAVTSLNAMRAGLLTRVMGIIGMFAAAGSIFFFNPSQPLLPLWIAFLAPLFAGRWPGGQPPAWRTGEAEPWPSAAEMRDQRTRERGGLAEPDPEPVEAKAAAKPHPSSKKRKRKRRA